MCKDCTHTDEYHKDLEDGEDEGDFSENEDLDVLEEDDYYLWMKEEMNDRLVEQRDDLLTAGIVWTIYNALWKDILERLSKWEASKEDIKRMKAYVTDQAFKKLSSVLKWDFRKVMSLYLLYVANFWWQSIFSQVGVNQDFEFKSLVMHRLIQDRVDLLWKGLDQTTTKYMADEIVAGLILGYSITQMNSSLKKLGKEIALDRTDLIMTTETNSMLQTARQQVSNTFGATRKIWHATEDEKTCKVCQDLDGETAEVLDSFDGNVMAPPLHPSCRCRVEYVFDNYMDLENIDLEGF
jgi:SPP1 gp7 family putative phage head morphogenesis protein